MNASAIKASCVQFALLLIYRPNLKFVAHSVPQISCQQESADKWINGQKYIFRHSEIQILSEMLKKPRIGFLTLFITFLIQGV